MADRIFGLLQAPATQQADADTHHWGMRFTVGAASTCIGGRAWVPTTGRPSTFFWQLWNDDTNTLIAEVNLNSLGVPANGAWMSFTSADFSTPGDVALAAGTTYIVNVFFQTGDGVFTDPGTFTIGNGVSPSVTNVTSDTGIFNNTQPQGTIPATPSATYFFADVEVNLAATTVTGTLNLTVPALEFDSAGELAASGTLNLAIPAIESDNVGLVTAAGALNLTIPALEIDLDGQLPVTGVLNLDLPALLVDLTGSSAAGGNIMGPCGWTIPDPLCCEAWTGFSASIQSAARDYAATILWAATGRRFGLCEVSVRPCGMRRCNDGMAEFFGYDWSSGTWVPYIFEGTWFNCTCAGICCCDPRCQVRLVGPVDSIVEVTIGGIAVPSTSYRVDDNHWLVRTDGECWPTCSDMDSDDGDNVFVVTYLRGDPIPSSLLTAASTLACEWGLACTGSGDCRLGNRVTSIARQGISIEMVSPEQLLDAGLTGIFEVDQVIRAFNPYRLQERLKIRAPELNIPRQVTSP